MFHYEMTNTQSIKSLQVCAKDMHDCMQLKVKIIIFHAQSIDLQRFYYRKKLNFRVLRLMWHTMIDDDRSRSFSRVANYAGCANLTVSGIKTSCWYNFHLYQYALNSKG